MQTDTLTENQKLFVRDAEEDGYEIVTYSGRGMYGARCPAITVPQGRHFGTRAKTRTDSLGRDVVVYCPT